MVGKRILFASFVSFLLCSLLSVASCPSYAAEAAPGYDVAPAPAKKAKKVKKAASGDAAPSSDDRGVSVVARNRDGGKRVALVIGNSAYRHTDSMPKLANPANDADDMAAALRRFGFEVFVKKNLTKEEMDEAIADFGRRIADSDAALFYYAGHGLQVRGQNYLVPVDANINTEAQVQYRAINVNQLLEEIDSSRNRVNIVMLDACRNNPISGKFRSGGSRGLAPPSSMPRGTVIVYATDPGNVAADGTGRNGQFTSGLLSAFKGKDLTLSGVLYAASKQVQDATDQQQTPYVNGPATVQREFSFISPPSMVDLQHSEVRPSPVASPAANHSSPPVEERPLPITVEEAFTNRAKLHNKQVVLTGTVVNVNNHLMKRNWIKVKGDAGSSNRTLTCTTQDTAEVGDLIKVSGTLISDRDFGAGYRYDVIVENATILKSEERKPQAKVASNELPKGTPLSGTVNEVLNGGGYTYLLIKNSVTSLWAAIPTMNVSVGQDIVLKPGYGLKGFTSKALNRTFNEIFFSAGPVDR